MMQETAIYFNPKKLNMIMYKIILHGLWFISVAFLFNKKKNSKRCFFFFLKNYLSINYNVQNEKRNE